MRPKLWILPLFVLAGAFGCQEPPSGDALIAAKADLTTRQFVAGLNAKNTTVLRTLIVLTSTTGGKPRALSDAEAGALVFPDPPFEQLGHGKPGFMVLRDGKQKKQKVHLIVVGEELKVLGSKMQLSAYLAEVGGLPSTPAGADVRVVRLMTPD